jgi:hypothetical protein
MQSSLYFTFSMNWGDLGIPRGSPGLPKKYFHFSILPNESDVAFSQSALVCFEGSGPKMKPG